MIIMDDDMSCVTDKCYEGIYMNCVDGNLMMPMEPQPYYCPSVADEPDIPGVTTSMQPIGFGDLSGLVLMLVTVAAIGGVVSMWSAVKNRKRK